MTQDLCQSASWSLPLSHSNLKIVSQIMFGTGIQQHGKHFCCGCSCICRFGSRHWASDSSTTAQSQIEFENAIHRWFSIVFTLMIRCCMFRIGGKQCQKLERIRVALFVSQWISVALFVNFPLSNHNNTKNGENLNFRNCKLPGSMIASGWNFQIS